MSAKEFKDFRLVGGTALSLQIGHRMSDDIDLFSDAQYGSLDFNLLELFLKKHFPFVQIFSSNPVSFGKSYVIGVDKENNHKLDLYYTDPFIQSAIIKEDIRLASVEEIIAMKIDVVQRGGRKKDFWDLHELLSEYGIDKMLDLHHQRYEYIHDRDCILKNFTDFSIADDDFDPICLRGKYWEFIKEDIEDKIAKYSKEQESQGH